MKGSFGFGILRELTHTLSIPGISSSQNKLDGHHWRVKDMHRREWHELVGYTVGRCTFEPKKATVVIIRIAKRLIDDLNVPAGCKWLLYAFVEQGWLVDDSREWCRVTTDQRKAEPGQTEHMEVTIDYALS